MALPPTKINENLKIRQENNTLQLWMHGAARVTVPVRVGDTIEARLADELIYITVDELETLNYDTATHGFGNSGNSMKLTIKQGIHGEEKQIYIRE